MPVGQTGIACGVWQEWGGKSRGKNKGKRKEKAKGNACAASPFPLTLSPSDVFPVNFFLVRLRGNCELRIADCGLGKAAWLKPILLEANPKFAIRNSHVSIPKHSISN
jgi:hypothetical protein